MPFDLTKYDAFIFDLDGTIWLSGDVLPGAAEFVARCRELGPVIYASNLSIPTVQSVTEELRAIGVATDDDATVISGVTMAAALARDGITEALCVTGPGVREAIRDEGISVVSVEGIDEAEWISNPSGRACVVAGWYEATMAELNTVGWLASHDVPLYFKTLDPGLPLKVGFEPGTGMMVAAIRALYDVPMIQCGKPSQIFADTVRSHFNGARNPLMIGDSIPSDVGLAEILGCDSLFLTKGKPTSEVRPIEGQPTPTYAATGLDDPNPVAVS